MTLARALSIPFLMFVVLLSGTASLGQSSAYDGRNAPTPPAGALRQSPAFATQSLLVPLVASTCTEGQTVLLIQDVVPWFAPPSEDPGGANFTELLAQQKNFCSITSGQLANMNLSGFKQIVIASAQNQTFYDNLFPDGIDTNLSTWVYNGGFLIAHLADSASGAGDGGTWNGNTFIGGLQHSGISGASGDDNIADPSNALIADNLSCPGGNCGVVIDDGLRTDLDGWGFSDHGYFTSLPQDTITILKQGATGTLPDSPVTIQYPYGSGTVLATLTTIEYRYVGGLSGGLPHNKKLLANEFAYPNVTTTQTGSTITPQTLNQSFVLNPIETQLIEFDFDYRTAFNSETLTIAENTVPTVTNRGITQGTYQQMVAGTALATTNCFLANGQKDANGNSLCTTLTLQCTNAANPSLAGDHCPQSSARNMLFKNIFDTNATITAPPPGFAFTLAMGSDDWQPGSCTLIGPELDHLCPRSLLTQLFVVGDPTAKGGGTGKTSNSTFIFGCCEPEWQTTPQVALWSRTTTVPVSFQSTPPPPDPTNNGYHAAQGESVTFGFEAPGATPDPTFPVASDQTLLNPISCPNLPDWSEQHPVAFTTSGSVAVPGEGPWELHFFSTDCDDMQELKFTKPASDTQNWASFKTVPFNVDLTAPTVTNLVLNPAPVNGTYFLNQPVQATLTCSDPLSGGVASGIASCGPLTSFGGQNPVILTNVAVPTSVAGTYTLGATDVAGNPSVQPFSYTVVALPPADVDVIEIGPLTAKSGSNATFIIGAWNKGPAPASNVIVSSTLPMGESLVSANFALVTCTLAGCSTPPPGASACAPAGSNGFTCTVPLLPAIQRGARSFTGIGVKVVTKITASKGAILKNTAKVNASNPNPDMDNTFTWTTKVY